MHAVLQSIPFDDPSAVHALAASAALAEGVTEHADEVAALVRSALASEIVQRAAVRRHWRESFVGTVEVDGVVLEGFVDLIYEEDDGSLVIVDYKTDAVPAAAIPARAKFYAPQVEAYARAVRESTCRHTSRCLLFLHPSSSTTVSSIEDEYPLA